MAWVSGLYKTTGRTEQIDDNPENPNHPKQPAKIIPRSQGSSTNPIIAIPKPLFGGTISVSTATAPYPGAGGRDSYSPSGPDGDLILLSSLLNETYSGIQLPPNAVIIDDL